jgi:hypothetical protein
MTEPAQSPHAGDSRTPDPTTRRRQPRGWRVLRVDRDGHAADGAGGHRHEGLAIARAVHELLHPTARAIAHSRRATRQRNGDTAHMRIGGSITTYPVRDTSTLSPATRRPRP